MTFFDKLLALVNSQLAAHNLAVNPENIQVRSWRVTDSPDGPAAAVVLGVVNPNLGEFTVNYPLANLTYLQTAGLKTDTVIDIPGGHTVQSLVDAINRKVLPGSEVDAELVQLRTEFTPSGDGEKIYVIEQIDDPQVPAYYGSIRLYAANARNHPVALHAIMSKGELLVNSNRDFFRVSPTGDLLPAGAYVGVASDAELGVMDQWVCWEIEQPVTLYLNNAAVVPATTEPSVLGLTIESDNSGPYGNGREILLKTNRNSVVGLSFWQDKANPFLVHSQLVNLAAGTTAQLKVYDIPENSWLEISSMDGGDVAMQAGMRYLAGQSLRPEYAEYRPTVILDADQRKCVRFRDLELLESPQYMLYKPEMSLGGEVAFPEFGGNTTVQTLDENDNPSVTVKREGSELVCSIRRRTETTVIRATIPYWDRPFTYYLGWSDGQLSLIVNDQRQDVPFTTTEWSELGLYYQLGGSGYGNFNLYRHFVGHRNDDFSRNIWNAEYWQ